jgi:hypothetical protein
MSKRQTAARANNGLRKFACSAARASSGRMNVLLVVEICQTQALVGILKHYCLKNTADW